MMRESDSVYGLHKTRSNHQHAVSSVESWSSLDENRGLIMERLQSGVLVIEEKNENKSQKI